MKYVLDANVFISAKNLWYNMKFCPGFWCWILHANTTHSVCSIESVSMELTERDNDELADWAKENDIIFNSNWDETTQANYQTVVNYVMSLPQFKLSVKEEFLFGADPWLIAYSMTNGATIVTHEKLAPDNTKKKIYIPNICVHFSVDYIDTFQLLDVLDAELILAA